MFHRIRTILALAVVTLAGFGFLVAADDISRQ